MLFGELREEVASRLAGDVMVKASGLTKTYAAGETTVSALKGVDLTITSR